MKDKQKKKKNSILIVIVFVTIIIGGGLFIGINNFNNNENTTNNSALKTGTTIVESNILASPNLSEDTEIVAVAAEGIEFNYFNLEKDEEGNLFYQIIYSDDETGEIVQGYILAENTDITEENVENDIIENDEIIENDNVEVDETDNDEETYEQSETENQEIAITNITLQEDNIYMMIGDNKKINAIVVPENTTEKLIYTSQDDSVIKVDNDGNISTVAEGSTYIIVSNPDNTIQRKVYVTVNKKEIKVNKVLINGSDQIVLGAGETVEGLYTKAYVEPADATNKELNYSSSNTEVVTIVDGVIEGRKTGKATIVITPKDGSSASNNIAVNVKKAPTSIKILDTFNFIKNGDMKKLNIQFNDGEYSNFIEYSSSDESVLSVTSTGVLEAKKEGTAVISVRTYNNVVVEKTITVGVPVSTISFNQRTTLGVGEKVDISKDVEIKPENATNKNLKYESSKPSVATIDENGKITGIKQGEATITITAKDGSGVKNNFKVYVEDAPTKVSLSNIFLEIGDIETLIPKVTGKASNLKFTSSDENEEIIMLSDKGKITALSEGIVEVTVETYNGKKDTCIVTVGTKVDDIGLDEWSVSLGENEEFDPMEIIKISPKNATNKKLSFSFDNDNFLSKVEKNGKVLIKSLKSDTHANLYVKAVDGSGTQTSIHISMKKAPKSIKFPNTSIEIKKGDKIQKNIEFNKGEYSRKIIYTSSNPSVATVDKNGLIVGKARGVATIQAETYNGKKATMKVNVDNAVETIKLNKKSLKLANKGDSVSLDVTISPTSASKEKLTWKSSNTSVATVDKNGKVTGKKTGKATITVTAADGTSTTDSCNVVVGTLVSDISISDNFALGIDETYKISTDVSPSNATNKTLSWSSSDTKIAVVDKNGNVTGKAQGNVVITAKATDGSEKAKTVVVHVKNKPTSISLSHSSYVLKVNGSIDLNSYVNDGYASKHRTWKSSNKSVATVDSRGVVVGKKAGTATITVETYNGKTDKCVITVGKAVTGVSLSPNVNRALGVGETVELNATVIPSDAQNKNIKWESSNSNVLTISKDGNITAKKVGKATITAVAIGGNNKKATISIEVKLAPNSVSLNHSTLSIKKGKTATLKPILTNGFGAYANKFTSTDKTIATVTNSGVVTGLKKGTVTIKYKTYNNKTATCKVTVK